MTVVFSICLLVTLWAPAVAFSVHSTASRSLGKTTLSALPDSLDLPSLKDMSISLPSFDMTAIKVPDVNLPSIDIPSASSLTENPQMLMMVGIGVLALAAVAVISGGAGTEPKAEVKPVPFFAQAEEASDLSIPYDAAARLAYRELKNLKESDDVDEVDFERFNELYIQTAVAEVTSKKLMRELAVLQAEAEQKASQLSSFASTS